MKPRIRERVILERFQKAGLVRVLLSKTSFAKGHVFVKRWCS